MEMNPETLKKIKGFKIVCGRKNTTLQKNMSPFQIDIAHVRNITYLVVINYIFLK